MKNQVNSGLRVICIFACLLIAVSSAIGQAYEPFNYSAGTPPGNGGTGWAGPWTGNGTLVVGPGLTFTGLTTSGSTLGGTIGGAATRQLQTPIAGTAGKSVVLQALIKSPVPGTPATQATLGNSPGGIGNNFIIGDLPQPDANANKWGMQNDCGRFYSNKLVVANQTAYLVTRIDFNVSGANDRMRLWVQTTGPAVPYSTLPPDVDVQCNLNTFGGVFWQTQQGQVVDEIRVDTTGSTAANLIGGSGNLIAGSGNFDVGVIPKGPGQCPAGSEYITIYMDDEDKNNKSSMSGWTGAASHRVTNHVNGTQLGFCRVNGLLFFNLGHANLINWDNLTTDPQKASVGAYDYSVLKLGASCPNGSKEHVRIIDSEDDHNKNDSTGDISPNDVHFTKRGKTALYFCLFTPSSGPSRTDFPDIGITYGVFAGKVAPPAGPGHRNYWLATGQVYTDDEDWFNADSTKHDNFSNDDIFAASAGLTIAGRNTTFYIAKVRNITGLCSRPVDWWNGSQVSASFDTANCFVRNAPSGSQPFVWANKYYIKPTLMDGCPKGTYDGVGCFLIVKPEGAFLTNNTFFVSPGPGNSCPSVPSSWTFNGIYCFFPTPLGTKAFVAPPFGSVQRLYTTMTRIPSCQDGSFDGANCYMGTPPPGTTAFIWSNNFYYAE